jgi:hypothetical protein
LYSSTFSINDNDKCVRKEPQTPAKERNPLEQMESNRSFQNSNGNLETAEPEVVSGTENVSMPIRFYHSSQ